jgi:hypothetical protein
VSALNEVLHWTGSRWHKLPAVGVYQVKFWPVLGQALHWNGRRSVLARIPEPGGASGLADVACPSPANCWAVGTYEPPSGSPPVFNEALHWNGRSWARASMPQPGGMAAEDINFLSSVRCPSTSTCLAVGTTGNLGSPLNQVLRWNGRSWSAVSVPSPGGTASGGISQLFGLACSSTDNCWAVGSYHTAGSIAASLNQVMPWNGSAWSQIPAPEPGGSGSLASQELRFATCGSAINCWAVGDFVPAGSTRVRANQAMHWDGGMWSVVRTPDPAGVASGDGNQLNAVRCVTATSCWAVGTAHLGSHVQFGQVLHWGGARWSVR